MLLLIFGVWINTNDIAILEDRKGSCVMKITGCWHHTFEGKTCQEVAAEMIRIQTQESKDDRRRKKQPSKPSPNTQNG